MPDPNEYQIPAFSAQAKTLVKAKLAEAAELEEQVGSDESDEEMLCDNIEQMVDELKKIDTQIEDIEVDLHDLDKAAYAVPDTDDGFKAILKERFGHDDFLEGQLEAIKILV